MEISGGGETLGKPEAGAKSLGLILLSDIIAVVHTHRCLVITRFLVFIYLFIYFNSVFKLMFVCVYSYLAAFQFLQSV